MNDSERSQGPPAAGGTPDDLDDLIKPLTAGSASPAGMLAAGPGRRTVLVLGPGGAVESAWQGPAAGPVSAILGLAAQFDGDLDQTGPGLFTRVRVASALWQVTAAGPGAP